MKKITLLLIMAFVLVTNTKAFSQSEPFLGEIRMVASNYAPTGWALCEGQLLSISQNTALFSLLGTTYGGDGISNFALPDFRGRVPMYYGTTPGLGLSSHTQGEASGSETNTITVSQLPPHSHTLNAVTTDGNQNDPTNGIPANTKLLDPEYSNATPNTTLNADTIGQTGGGQPVNNMQPYLTVTFIIALQGIYPSHP